MILNVNVMLVLIVNWLILIVLFMVKLRVVVGLFYFGIVLCEILIIWDCVLMVLMVFVIIVFCVEFGFVDFIWMVVIR